MLSGVKPRTQNSSHQGGQAGTKCETGMKPRTQDSSHQGDHVVITT